ncbi:unnamed protein product [Caenorhabditis nigoni]
MASDIENVTEKFGKLSIDPVYDTNWCDMPAEVKLVCIGKMEFEERLSLRCTAKVERSLADSQKIQFTKGVFWGDHAALGFELFRDKTCDFWMRSEDMNKSLELMKYVKRIGIFENLEIYFGDSVNNNFLAHQQQFFTGEGRFAAKHIALHYCKMDKIIAVLRNINNGVESIKIDTERTVLVELEKILAISHVQNVPYWHIQNCERTDSLHNVAQMWIDKNAKIGSIFQVSVKGVDGSFEEFLDHFDDRILSENYKRARIRTNDPDRHILLERGLDHYVQVDDYLQFYRLIVIPAEVKESEYDDNCKEWICKMDPVMQNMYDFDYNHGR